jgi:hypothetical protein
MFFHEVLDSTVHRTCLGAFHIEEIRDQVTGAPQRLMSVWSVTRQLIEEIEFKAKMPLLII